MKQPHEPVPVIPSVHANRLGVHEHPAVRDVFGMKEPWNVTPGEGFHVARITEGQVTTPGTMGYRVESREGIEEPSEIMEGDEQHLSVVITGLPPPHPELYDNSCV